MVPREVECFLGKADQKGRGGGLRRLLTVQPVHLESLSAHCAAHRSLSGQEMSLPVHSCHMPRFWLIARLPP